MPRIFAVFPTSVPLSGGVGISIFGTNLHSDRVEINVLVGRKKAITTLLTSTVLMSLCPELDEVANLSVALSVGNTLIEGDRIPLHVSQEVSLLRVVPTLSYDGSQVTLTLHGAGFHERMIASIGNKRLSCLVNDVQSAVCESEALSLGNSWLHILGSGIEPVLLQVLERPKVYSVQPTEMSKAESGTITLFGQGFTGHIREIGLLGCKMSFKEGLKITFFSSTMLMCQSTSLFSSFPQCIFDLPSVDVEHDFESMVVHSISPTSSGT
eukprot:768770-Hanusia_phi.AAC.2